MCDANEGPHGFLAGTIIALLFYCLYTAIAKQLLIANTFALLLHLL